MLTWRVEFLHIKWFYHMVTIAYFTFEVMGFGMKHWEKGLHVQKMLELWAAFYDSLEIGPIFTGHIHAKKLRTGQLLLQVQGIGKYFSPVHIEGSE